MNVYISRGQKSSGPYSIESVRSHLVNGLFFPTDLAWHEGLENWTPVSELVGKPVVPELTKTTSGSAEVVRASAEPVAQSRFRKEVARGGLGVESQADHVVVLNNPDVGLDLESDADHAAGSSDPDVGLDLESHTDHVVDPSDPDAALKHHNSGKAHAKKGEYDLALQQYQYSLDIRMVKCGPDHLVVAQLYQDIGRAHDAEEEYVEALKNYHKAVNVQLKQHSLDYDAVLRVYNDIGKVHARNDEYEQLLENYLEVLNFQLEHLDSDHPDVVQSYNKIAKECDNKGEYDQALENYYKVLAIQAEQQGSDHPLVAQSYNRIGRAHHNKSEYGKALELYQKALAIRLKKYGEDHPKLANSYRRIGLGHLRVGEYEQGLEYLHKSLAIRLKKYGEDHVEVAISYSNIGRGCLLKGEYDQALKNHREALDIWLYQKSSEHIEVANCYNDIGKVYSFEGEYPQALENYQKSLDIRLKKLGLDNRQVARSYSNIGKVHDIRGEYDQALDYYRKALDIDLKRLGPNLGLEHDLVARSYNDIGRVYDNMGEYDQALELLREALYIRRRKLGPDHPDVATSYNDIGKVHEKKEEYDQALEIYEAALSIRLEKLDKGHPSTVRSYNNIGLVHLRTREYDQALDKCLKALNLGLKHLGENNLEVAVSYDAIGRVRRAQGEYDQALKDFQKALEIRLKKLGEDHPDVATSYNDIGVTQFGSGNSTAAFDSARKARDIESKRLKYMLSFTSERGRLAYRVTQQPYDLMGTLGSAPDLATAVLHNKGIILASLMEDQLMARRSKDPAVKELYDQLCSAQQVLHNTQQAILRRINIPDDQLKHDREKVENLQRRLARNINDERKRIGKARRALSITPEGVQKCLLKEEVLLEFIRYSHYLEEDQWQERYGVVILAGKGEAQWVSLGVAEEIESLVDGCLEHMHPGAGRDQDESLEPILRELYSKLLQPVVEKLPAGAKSLIFSPEDGLNFVSFAMLLTDKDRFLCEDYAVKYVSSGRDLMPGGGSVSSIGKVVVFANPDKSLPGTEKEAAILDERAPDWNLQSEIYLREEATEEKFISVVSPYILHVTTHGYFENPEKINFLPRSGSKLQSNPMHENLLVFAPQEKEPSPSYENDGILTAAEASLMNLKGTRIMMLAACMTGHGELAKGEGVMGLRRAFSQAGVQNLVITLWVTWDNSCPPFVKKFYDRAMKEGNPSRFSPMALWTTQRDMMADFRKRGKVGEIPDLCPPAAATLWACRHFGAYVLNHS